MLHISICPEVHLQFVRQLPVVVYIYVQRFLFVIQIYNRFIAGQGRLFYTVALRSRTEPTEPAFYFQVVISREGMFVIKIIKLIIKLLVEIIMTPIRLIWLVIGKPVRKAEDFLKGYLKKVLHLSAVYAKINKRRIDNQLRFIRRKKE